LLALDGQTSEPNLSPDGKTLAFDWCKPDYSCGIYTRPLAGGEIEVLAGKDVKKSMPLSPRWSPDGKRISFVRIYSHFDNHLILRDSNGGAEHDLGVICDREFQHSWRPDGRLLIASVYTEDPPRTFDCRLMLFSGEKGRRVRQIATRGGASAFSPDGRMLAYANGGALMLLNLTRDGQPTGPAATRAREPREISSVNWTPDGKQILYQGWGDVAYLRRVMVGLKSPPQAIPGLSSEISITQLLADGSALATETTQIEALWRADLTSKAAPEIVADPGCSSGAPGCSPDRLRRAFITERTGISEIWLANSDGTNERPLVRSVPGFENPKDAGVPSLAGWSPDGKWIAFTVFPRRGNADIRTYLYVISSSGGVPQRLGKEAYSLDMPTWSPDSKSLYAVQGWQADNGPSPSKSLLVRVSLVDGTITSLGADGIWPRVSPDGKVIYFFTSPRPKLSRIPIGGGAAERLWEKDNLLWFCAGLGARYLYLFQQPPRDAEGQTHTIIRFDPESRQAIPLADIPFGPRSAYLSADERFLYFEQQEDPKQRVVLVRGLL